MHKKRLIFTLLYADGFFMLSRNFGLQKVGDVQWLKNNYNFKHIASSIDELVILDVSRHKKDHQQFIANVHEIIDSVFVPIAVGGGIDNEMIASFMLSNGADKLILNSVIFSNPSIVTRLVERYGSQCIVASVDYKLVDSIAYPYINNGQLKLESTLQEYIDHLSNLNVGELLINSMDRDGTGQGYDISLIEHIVQNVNVPVIVSGGAGKKEHFLNALLLDRFDAVATAHLFNFMGNALPAARDFLLENNISLARW